MTRTVTIIIDGPDAAATLAAAQRIVNTINTLATWANTNFPSKITQIQAITNDVVVTPTRVNYVDQAGTLVIGP